jgi:predicted transcriptional regulator of viral defense system
MKKSREDIVSALHKKITDFFPEENSYVNTNRLKESGIHPRDIKALTAEGLLIRIKNGLYRYTGGAAIPDQGFVDVSLAVPGGVICLLSALSFYQLTTFNPTFISVAIHRKQWKPRLEYPPVEFFYFSESLFRTGIDEITIGGYKVPVYCPEKTICDSFRYRDKLGLDTAKEALTEYLKRKDRSIETLLKYAAICRVKPMMETWLHALL